MVDINRIPSSAKTTSVLVVVVEARLCFSLCTEDCRTDECCTDRSEQYILKYLPIQFWFLFDSCSDPGLHQHRVDMMAVWRDNKALLINTKSTEGMFLMHHQASICLVLLLTSWKDHDESVCKRTKQRIYIFCHLRSLGAKRQILVSFLLLW